MDDSHDTRKTTTTPSSSNNEETDSDRKPPSTNSEAGSLRADTPGPMPKYIYTKQDLMGIAQSPASKRRPPFLQKDFDTSDGYWDPERWTRSFDSKGDGSRGNSPLTFGSSRDRKRPTESDREPYKRRTSADPKARLKEEDEDLGIVLSPQRRSFGTGCHVTTSNKLRPGSPTDADPRDRRDRGGDRRIGSGRIQIDRERERDVRDRDLRDRDSRDRDTRDGRDHRDIRDRDGRDHRDRDHRDLRDRDRDIRDRDDRRDPRDFRDSRGRFDRDDRRGFDRNDHFRRDDRDFRDRRDLRDRRFGRYRRHEEEEPEWFSSGPTSQSDTIELRGFEEPKKEKEQEPSHEEEYMEEENEQRGEVEEEPHTETQERKEDQTAQVTETAPHNALPAQAFADLLQGQQSQGIRSDSPALPFGTDFDFNQIFNIENIPGLSDLPLFGNTEEIDNPSLEVSGSKFSRWFQGDSGAPGSSLFANQQDSRRSSINEGEFGYLNVRGQTCFADLVGGQKSPSGPSPPPHMMGHPGLMPPNLFSQFPRFDTKDAQSMQQQTNILELLHNAKMNAVVCRGQDETMMMNNVMDAQSSIQPARPGRLGGIMASDLERDLKAMILPGAAANQKPRTIGGKTTPPPPMPKIGLGVPGKITTVAELEANLKEMDMSNNNRQHKAIPGGASHGLGVTPGVAPASMASGQAGHTLPGNLLPNVGPGQPVHTSRQRPGAGPQGIHQQQQQQLPQQPSPTDMTAFNKLLGMMKQAGTLGQAQKEMQKVAEGRVSPPQAAGLSHQQGQPHQITAAHGGMGHLASNQQQQPASQTNQINAHQQKDILQMLTQQNIQQQIQQQFQQQAKMKQQQQQQQHQIQEQIMKFVKQNPAIITPKPPASPCPPALAAVAATLQPPTLGSHLQPPASPRCPSPGIPGLLQQPSSSTPNAPSPIMFGSQPPMHLTAPSPIHASQLQPPPSPNTLQVTGQASKQIARVPSPQELVAHTQMIMQNALIKKQLEDQKERFMRKQQDSGVPVARLKSPNAPVTSGTQHFQFPPINSTIKAASSAGSASIATSMPQQPQPKVLPAFTPTSVIRKMANEKAEAKENGKDDDRESNTPTGVRPGVPQVILQADTPPHPGTPGSVSSEGGVTITVPSNLQQLQENHQQQALVNAHFLQQHQQQPQPCMPGQPQLVDAKRRPLIGQGTMQSIGSSVPNQQPFMGGRAIVKGSVMSPPGGTPPVATVQPQPHQPQPTRPLQAGAGAQSVPNLSIAHTTAASQHRAIVGSQASNTVATSTTAAGNLELNKLLEQQRLQQQQQRISPTSPNMQRQAAAAAANQGVLNAQLAAAAAARLPGVQSGIVRPGIPTVNTAVANAAAANALLVQRMMQSGGIQNPVRPAALPQAMNMNQINQLNQIAALQAQAAQPRPAAATIDPRLQATRPGMYPNQLSPMMAAGATQPGLASSTLSAAALNAAISRALSPQPQMAAPIASLANIKPDGNNLSKWFGNDLFKQQLPNMPPLPAQGQKVLTVDEIERRSQTVTN